MAPIKPVAGGASAQASTAAAPAPARAGGKKKEKAKGDLGRVQVKLERAIRALGDVHKVSSAWLAALGGKVENAPELGSISRIAQATEAKALNRLAEAEQVLQALVEARWAPPKVESGRFAFKVGDLVEFRDGHLKWGTKLGVFTKEEAASLVVTRVAPGKEGKHAWISAQASSSKNHFGPMPANRFKRRDAE